MSRLRLLSRQLKTALAALAGWLAVHAPALAQAAGQPVAKKDATTGAGPYVMAYLLLILAIALGMLVVCRSSNRRDRARPEVYLETNILEQDKEAEKKRSNP